MQARRHIVILWLCAVIQLVASIQPALGLRLCVADDGHTAVELAHADPECLGELRRHHPGAGAFSGDELAPHSCRDVSIVESRLHRLVVSHRSDGLSAVALGAPSLVTPRALGARSGGRVTTPPPLAPLPDLLRSVVLVV
jgi:hypothetical protein